MRKELPQNDLSFGRQVASIPIIIFEKACRDGYDLRSKDKITASKEMIRFLQSEEGQKCLVTNDKLKPKRKH